MESIQDKIDRLWLLRETQTELSRQAGMLEQEIVEQMDAEDATTVLHPTLKVTIPTERKYDAAKVATLAESIPPEHFDRLYIPEHEEVVVRSAKVDGRVALELMKAGFKRELEDCLLPTAKRLKIEPKGEK